MTIPNSEHLLELAERLTSQPGAGSPRQADLRRAVSTAYYALFHLMLRELADEFVGVTQRKSPRYALVYRSVDHGGLKRLCTEAIKPPTKSAYSPYMPAHEFSVELREFASLARELRQRRLEADYDPRARVTVLETTLLVKAARRAVEVFRASSDDSRKAFLTLLLCPPRPVE